MSITKLLQIKYPISKELAAHYYQLAAATL